MRYRKISVDGKEYRARFLGKGLFSRAYVFIDDNLAEKVCLYCSGDYSKEAISLFADQSLPHVPQIQRHEDVREYQVFTMPLYQRLVKKRHPEAYRQWQLLEDLAGSVAQGAKEIEAFISSVRNHGEHTLADALCTLYDSFSNYCYEHMIMEFPKFNVSVDSRGQLILRDCLADQDSIKRKCREMTNRYERRNRNAYA